MEKNQMKQGLPFDFNWWRCFTWNPFSIQHKWLANPWWPRTTQFRLKSNPHLLWSSSHLWHFNKVPFSNLYSSSPSTLLNNLIGGYNPIWIYLCSSSVVCFSFCLKFWSPKIINPMPCYSATHPVLLNSRGGCCCFCCFNRLVNNIILSTTTTTITNLKASSV